ncbi:MAG: DUF1439 domain-containing protein [Bermanella sp.]
MFSMLFNKACMAGMLLLISQVSIAFEYTLEFTQPELQAKISAMMPVTKKTMLATVVVDNAKLELIEGSDKLAIAAKLNAVLLGNLNATGDLKIQGTLSYNAKEGAFYLKDPEIIELNINEIPPRFHDQIKQLAQKGVAKKLSNQPVYKLKDDDMKQNLAKSMLKSLQVKNKTLIATLGLF